MLYPKVSFGSNYFFSGSSQSEAVTELRQSHSEELLHNIVTSDQPAACNQIENLPTMDKYTENIQREETNRGRNCPLFETRESEPLSAIEGRISRTREN